MWQEKVRWARHIGQNEAGQSLVIIAAAVFALLVIIGLAIDLGLLYIERISLGRACDAAALAGAQELPFEEFAVKRAIEYLQENGYNTIDSVGSPRDLGLIVDGPANAADFYRPIPVGGRGTITIDTERYENDDTGDRNNSADKIRVSGQISVPMHIMVLLGFREVAVQASAVAENVTNLDIVLVFDESGSMNDDTYCYSENPTGSQNNNKPCYIASSTEDYPAGERMYLPFDSSFCGAQAPINYNGTKILVAEAEYFSYSTSYGAHDYHRNNLAPDATFWMIQRTKNSQASGYRYQQDDMRGAHLMHMPHLIGTKGHSEVTSRSPRLDYDFNVPEGGRWYIWIRAQCGHYLATSVPGITDSCIAHWGADGTPLGSTSRSNFPELDTAPDSLYGIRLYENDREGGSDGANWTWVRLGNRDWGAGMHQVNLWGGGSGFRVDKIVVTTNSQGPGSQSVDRAPAFIRDNTPPWNNTVRAQQYQTYYVTARRQYGGPGDTRGRTGQACSKCNPIYGLRINEDLDGDGTIERDEICDNTGDDMWDDHQPIRATKEAAKNFVKRLKARFDQVGFVKYSSDASIDRELNCLLTPARGPDDRMPDEPGVWDPAAGPDRAWLWCYDHRSSSNGLPPGNRQNDETHGSIIGAIESMQANGNTDIADGMIEGMKVLSTETGHYGRPNALKFIVLMTDGQPNEYPNSACYAQDLWPDNSGTTSENRASDCVIYYAREAHARGITIFTIGLGVNLDDNLMRAVAEETGGEYFPAPTPDQLDGIMQEIADKIFLRLVE